MSKKQLILNVVDTLVSSFLYYDRKEDEDLPRGEIEKCISNGDISIDEIVSFFRDRLMKGVA